MKRAAMTGFLLLIAGIVLALYIRSTSTYYHVRTSSANEHAGVAGNSHLPPDAYLYYALKESGGIMLARAPKGANNQPLSAPQPIILLGNGFGLSESDSVSSLQLSPDGNYLAIDGSSDHGDFVWVYDTQHMTIRLAPANVFGNFLHWLPRGNRHSFLYRPMFPLGPSAPMDGNRWNPGLWIVDAATGEHKNINIGIPSAELIDASPSPDGTRIIYSITKGLGLGSETWIMNSDGTNPARLFGAGNAAQSIAGLFAWSGDGTHIAYERLTDSPTPFLPASVWVMNNRGGQQRQLAVADGGHGFSLVWAPDNRQIAFIARTNIGDRGADALSQHLQSAIGVANIDNGTSWLVASPQQTHMQLNIDPVWAANSGSITFTALAPVNRLIGGTPRYWSARVIGPLAAPQDVPISGPLQHVVAGG